MKRKVKRVEIGCMSNIGGLRFYEIKVYFDNEAGEERLVRKDIGFTPLKRLGVVKTFRGTKKLKDWFNSEEGRTWLVERLNSEYDQYIA